MSKAKKIRPDFSDYVVHFTTKRKPFGDNSDLDATKTTAMTGDAYSKLESILSSGEIWASTMPWTNQKAVCFTECTWGSLLDHAKQYSPFGVGFSKAFLFGCGGGPAIYMRANLYEKQRKAGGFHKDVHSFVTFSGLVTPLNGIVTPTTEGRKMGSTILTNGNGVCHVT